MLRKLAHSTACRGNTHHLHGDGRGAAHTFKHRPFRLVYSERFPSRTDASARERQLKRWSRQKKAALIAGNLERLKRLSKRRS